MALVTLITDASHCPNTLAGGYGVWVAGQRGKQAFGGAISGTKDSSEIESKALCNGLYHGIKSGLICRGDTVLMQSDCDAALKLLACKRTPRESEFDILDWMADTTMKNGITLTFRHVKGHTNKKDSRSKAQDHCDKLAKKHMVSERKRLSGASVEQPRQPTLDHSQPEETNWAALKNKLHQIAARKPLLRKA